LTRFGRLIASGSAAVLIAGWSVVAATPAFADDWTIAFFIGGCSTGSNTLTLDRSGNATHVVLTPVEYADRSFESPPYYGYRIGRSLSPHLGIEAEFIHSKVFARTAATIRATGTVEGSRIQGTFPLSSIVERFAMSHGLNFVLANVVYRQPIGRSANPRAAIMGRTGAGITVPHVESTIAGESREQYEIGGLGLQAALGAEIRVTRRFYSFGEFKVTTTAESVAWAAGTLSGRFTTLHAIAGIAWHL
jgi:hypothetical protein